MNINDIEFCVHYYQANYRKHFIVTETTCLVLLASYKLNHGYGVAQFLDGHANGR